MAANAGLLVLMGASSLVLVYGPAGVVAASSAAASSSNHSAFHASLRCTADGALGFDVIMFFTPACIAHQAKKIFSLWRFIIHCLAYASQAVLRHPVRTQQCLACTVILLHCL